jgi:hypothetical protein
VNAVTVSPEQLVAAVAAERQHEARVRNRQARLRSARRLQLRAEAASRRARAAWLSL